MNRFINLTKTYHDESPNLYNINAQIKFDNSNIEIRMLKVEKSKTNNPINKKGKIN